MVEFRDIDVERDGAMCVQFRLDSFVESFGTPERFYDEAGPDGARYLEGLRAKIRSLPGSCVHAWLGNTIVGQIEMRRDDASPDEARVLLYYLTPEHRGSGLGDALDAFVMAFLARTGVKRAMLRVSRSNARAVAYYLKHGWRSLGDDPDHPEVLVMERDVTQPLPGE